MLEWLTGRSHAPAEPPAAPALRDPEREALRSTLDHELRRAESRMLEELDAIGLARALAHCDELLEQQRAASQEAGQKQFLDFQVRHAYDRKRARLEAELAKLADPRIDAFLAELQHRQDHLGRDLKRYEGLSAPHPRTGVRRTLQGSNLPAIQLVSAAIVEARTRAEALKLAVVPDVEAALEAIRQTIPTVADAEAAIARDGELQPAS